MHSYIFTAAALLSAVVNGGAVLRREEECEEPSADLPCGATESYTYTVVKDDTLTVISTKTGVGICDIAKASKIEDINVIQLDQELTIPSNCQTTDNSSCVTPVVKPTWTCVLGLPNAYSVREGDSFSQIATNFNITLPSLTAANPDVADPSAITPGEFIHIPLCPDSSCRNVAPYIIAEGDIFFELAAKFDVTVGQLLFLNPSAKPTALAIGQEIILPSLCANETTSET